MKAYVTVRIDPQDVFDELTSDEKKVFLFDNLSILSDDDIVKELEYRGYNVTTTKL